MLKTAFEKLWIEHGGIGALVHEEDVMLGKIVGDFFIHLRPINLRNKFWSALQGGVFCPASTRIDHFGAFTDFRMATEAECAQARIKFVPPPAIWKPITDAVRGECLVCKYNDDDGFTDVETVLFTDDGSFIYQGETFHSASDCGLTHYILLSDLNGGCDE